MDQRNDSDDSLVGRVLDGRYRVERILGAGGMGAVYQGKHELLGTDVAIKVMRSSAPDAAKRFLAEARRTFRLDHANCVRVTDAGVAPGELLYLIMELLEGRTLGEEIENDGQLAADRVAHMGAQIAAALACAHDLGYVHRDIKPDNIMLLHRGGDPDFTKVLDFGLAKLTDEARLDGKHSVASFTRNGMVFGTPHYMSPEQAQGHKLDARSDLYSLGIVLYEALAGGPPFDSDSDVEVLIAHVTKKPPPLADYCDVPPALDRVVMRLLAKDPDGRPTSALEVADELARLFSAGAAAAGAHSGRVAASETLTLGEEGAISTPRVSRERSTAPTAATASLGPSVLRREPTRRSPLVFAAVLALLSAVGISAWVVSQKEPRRDLGTLDAALATAATEAGTPPVPSAHDAGPADSTTSAAADAAADTATEPVDAPSSAERKAEALHRRALAAQRAGKGELSYLPSLQAAYKLDRKNRKIRESLIKALLGSKGKAQRELGCDMIKRSKQRFERAGCGSGTD